MHTQTRSLLRHWKTTGILAAVSGYALFLVFGEPLQSYAAEDTDTISVAVTVTAEITQNCDPTAVSLGSITTNQNTGAYSDSRATTCSISTNNAAGYTLSWNIQTGTGAAGSRTGTGHLNGYAAGHRIAPLKPASSGTPETFDSVSASDARWAGRVSSTSTTTGGAGKDWGTDASSEKWLNVATGSTVSLVSRSSQTDPGGDTQKIGFKVIIGSTAVVPSDVYKAAVTLTVVDN